LIGDSSDLKLLFGSESNAVARQTKLTGPVLVIYFYRALLRKGEELSDGHRIATEEQPIHVGYSLHFPSRETVKVSVPKMETNQSYLVNEVFQESFDWDDATDEDDE
jgi:hypothetical protein